MQIQEFDNRFNEVASELRISMDTLSTCDNFGEFDIPKILWLAKIYQYGFEDHDKRRLKIELPNFCDYLRANIRFVSLNDLSSLERLMVKIKKHLAFKLV